jgi:hypothetical protein
MDTTMKTTFFSNFRQGMVLWFSLLINLLMMMYTLF